MWGKYLPPWGGKIQDTHRRKPQKKNKFIWISSDLEYGCSSEGISKIAIKVTKWAAIWGLQTHVATKDL